VCVLALPIAFVGPAAIAQPEAGDWTEIAHDHPQGQDSFFDDVWSDGTDMWAAGYRRIPVAGVVEYRTWVQRCGIATKTSDLQNTLDLEAAPAYNTIEAITGTSTNDIWIGGTGKVPFGDKGTLVEHFDGKKWSIVPTPITRGDVHGMSAVAPDDVWAVGNDDRAGINALAMHWNGATWTQVPVAVEGCVRVYRLWDIDATGSRPVAVGHCLTKSDDAKAIVISYDGHGWHAEDIVGKRPKQIFEMSSVNWIGRTAWAGGMTERGHAVALQLQHGAWVWTRTPKNAALLSGVAGRPHDLWGVGHGWQNVLLTMHWDGTKWTDVPDLENGRFEDVALEPDGTPWAVGTDTFLSLIERYEGPLR
jgi:hypothetical protein